MPHLDNIRDENTHGAIAQAQRVHEGGEAFFAFMKANDDHFSHLTQCLFDNDCDTCAVFNAIYVGTFPAEQTKQGEPFKDETKQQLKHLKAHISCLSYLQSIFSLPQTKNSTWS